MSSGGWVPHPKGDERRRSAVNVARLALSAEDILPEHRHWLLSVAVWKYTEADGKWNPRFRSRAALGVTDKRRLNHEHVFPRRWLRERMLAEPDRYREIMAMAVACLVTRDEHLRLTEATRLQPELEGWSRYAAAAIEVVDLVDAAPTTRAPAPGPGDDTPTAGTSNAARYRGKHVRARRAVGLDPSATSILPPLAKHTRVRGLAGGLAGHEGTVTRPSWAILPDGQMVVRFDKVVAGPYRTIAVLPEEVEPVANTGAAVSPTPRSSLRRPPTPRR
jgi:hypothetical protein